MASEADAIELDLFGIEIASRQEEWQVKADRSRFQLQGLTGLTDIQVEPEALADTDLGSVRMLLDRALEARPDRAAAVEALHRASLRRSAVRGESFPSVDLVATYGKEPEISADRGIGAKVYLNVSMPLYSGFRQRNRESAACHRVRELHSRLERLDREIEVDILTACRRLEMYRSQREGLDDRLKAVEHCWKLVKEEYDRGVRGAADVVAALERWLFEHLRGLEVERRLVEVNGELLYLQGRGEGL